MSRIARMLAGLALFTALLGATVAVEPAAATPTPVGTADAGMAIARASGAAYGSKVSRRCRVTGRVLCIDKTRGRLYYLKNGRIIRTMDARFGCARTRTREGSFRVQRKYRYIVSSLYHTPMPYSMFFSGGQAVHYSSDFARRGYAGCSHGCVNIRARATLAYVYKRIRVGDRVIVYRS